MNWITDLAVVVAMALVAASPAASSPGEATGSEDAAAADAFTVYPLSTGKLFVPAGYRPKGDSFDLLLHFHGAEATVQKNLATSGKKALLLIINYPGLSSAYSTPFSDRKLLNTVLAEARKKAESHFGRDLRMGKLCISCFSAGYGAVREILSVPEYMKMITEMVIADSIYAGYAGEAGTRVPAPEQMTGFAEFARRAAIGQVWMIITHSQLVPGSYASTRETADVLLNAAGTTRKPAAGIDATGMRLESTADKGGFHMRSYQGTEGEDHMNHLRRIGVAFKLTSLP